MKKAVQRLLTRLGMAGVVWWHGLAILFNGVEAVIDLYEFLKDIMDQFKIMDSNGEDNGRTNTRQEVQANGNVGGNGEREDCSSHRGSVN